MLIHILWFSLGLVLLVKGGDWFVDGAVGLAEHFHMPKVLIGATVVSIGTTLPEVLVSVSSAIQGQSAMAYGNATGSIICNSALIAALTIAIRPSEADGRSLIIPASFFCSSVAVAAAVAYSGGNFTRPVGLILLFIFVNYMIIAVRSAVLSGNDIARIQGEEVSEEKGLEEKQEPIGKFILLLVIGAALIAFGADLLVDHGVAIAELLGVPQSVIALTFVALGTSLPELITAITSLAKGESALSLGNILGANLFNLVLVMGTSVSIAPFSFSTPGFSTITIGGRQIYTSLVADTPLMIAVMAILAIPAIKRNRVMRWQGIVLLAIYAAFCIFQFTL